MSVLPLPRSSGNAWNWFAGAEMVAEENRDTTALRTGVAVQTPPATPAAHRATAVVRPKTQRPAALQAEKSRYGRLLMLGLALLGAGAALAFLMDWPVLVVALVAGLAAFSGCNAWLYRGKQRQMRQLQSEAQEYLKDLS